MQEMIAKIRKFRDDRDWKQFHDPKNLAVSISIEAAELLEIFQWMTGEQAALYATQNKERVSDEIADVAIYLIELADIVGVDLARAIDDKLDKNAKKYPVEKGAGRFNQIHRLKVTGSRSQRWERWGNETLGWGDRQELVRPPFHFVARRSEFLATERLEDLPGAAARRTIFVQAPRAA